MSTSPEQTGQGATVPPVLPPVDINIPNLPRCCKATTISLTISADATEAQIVSAVEVIEKRDKGHQWHLGDALRELKERHPERGIQMLSDEADKLREKFGYPSRKQAWQVSCRFPQGTRVPSLSWSHHRAAAFFDTLDERVHWINLARDNGWSVHELEKATREATVEPDAPVDPDLYVLKDPAVRGYLETDIARQRSQFLEVPENAPFLRDLLVSRIEASQWQLDRTVDNDCDIVRDAVAETMGTWQQVFYWLKDRSRVISPPDVRAYLGQLRDAGRISEQLDEKPNPKAKGTTSTVYKPKRNDYDDKRDEEKRSLVVL